MLLNSHPQVYGGSELSRFHNRFDSAVCSAHGRKCDVWTVEARTAMANAQAAEFYHILSNITGHTLLVDASKTLKWFNADFLECAFQQGVEFHFVYLLKHPMRHATSFLMNRMCRKHGVNRTFSEAKSFLSERHTEALSFVRSSLPNLREYVETIRSKKHYIRKYGSVKEIKLEEIISNPDAIFSTTAKFFGIDKCNFSVNYDNVDFTHPIGGNSGALAKVLRPRKSDHERVSRYRERGLAQDDKWELLLPEKLLEAIYELPVYWEVCSHMGYTLWPSYNSVEILPDAERAVSEVVSFSAGDTSLK